MDENFRILDVNEDLSFKKKIEAINWCTEKNYKSTVNWQVACWPSNRPKGIDFRIWFPRLSDKKNGIYLPTSNGFINYLSDDWDYFYYDDLSGRHTNEDPNEQYLGISIIFAKDYGGDYVFRGVFKLVIDKSGPNHFVHNRIATKIKLIGKPVNSYELLDGNEKQIDGDINTPKKPKGIVRKNDGTVRYICGLCGHSFIKSQRCPECGQLVKE